jgi:two-component system chemotaxis sensor kinase CheA
MSMDHEEVNDQDLRALVARIVESRARWVPADPATTNALRASFQQLALHEGVDGGTARVAMGAARALKSEDGDEENRIGLVDEAIGALESVAEPVPGSKAEASAGPTEPAAGCSDSKAVMRSSDDPLLRAFLEEAAEHITAAEENLLELAEDPGDSERLHAVFRSIHTIKGGAGVLGLEEVLRFAHAAESVFDLARDGRIRLDGHPMDRSFEALDVLVEIVESLTSGEEFVPLPARYGSVLAELEAIAGLGEVRPRTDDGATVENASAAGAGEPQPEEEAQASRTGSGPRRRTSAQASVKVATDRLDAMVDLVGELVITTAMVQQGASVGASAPTELQRSIGDLAKVTGELQHIAMSMRMVPLKSTFQRAARIVRDVAAECGKSIRFRTDGEDTELDRNVVEKLADPLIHMLRNAVDHGIERPEAREAAGKEATGEIRLEAFHESGNVVLRLSDDGGGLDRDRILSKACDAGLLTTAEAEELSDAEVWHLIFHPGLSTAQEVSSVSGRGVGMDVVRKNIEALRGSIEIDSSRGLGSRITIRLPLTLAIIDAIVVTVQSRKYILPTLTIESFLKPSREDLHNAQGRGELLTIRDRVLPIHRLADLLGHDAEVTDLTEGLLALTSGDGHDFALLVDDLSGQQQVVIKSLGPGAEASTGVSGAAILSDGTVGLILDPAGLARVALAGRTPNRLRAPQEALTA